VFQRTSQEVNENIDEITDKFIELQTRLQALEHSNDSWQGRVRHYGGLIIQGIWVIVVCYALFKLGLNPTPLP